MRWLIRLYPPAWRRRYGQELEELLATQPASLRTVLDLIAGAVDAWFHPQPLRAATGAESDNGEGVPEMPRFGCTGYGVNYTATDSVKAAAFIIGGTLALLPVLKWARGQFGENPYLDSLALVFWLVPLLLGLSFTEFKGRSARVKAVFIGGPSVLVIAIALVSAWLSA